MAYNLVGGHGQLAELMKEYAAECGWKDVPEIYVDRDPKSEITTFRTEPVLGNPRAAMVTDEQVRQIKAGEVDPKDVLTQLLGALPDWTTGGPPNGLNSQRGGKAQVITVGPNASAPPPPLVPAESNVVFDPDCPPDQIYIMDGVDWGKKTVVMHPRLKGAYDNLGYGPTPPDQVNYPKLESFVTPLTKDVLESVRQRRQSALDREMQRERDLLTLKRELKLLKDRVELETVDVKPKGRRVRVV